MTTGRMLLNLRTIISVWCIASNAAACVSLPGRSTTMTQVTDERTLNDEQRAAEEQRLKSYLEAESKYAVAPIPAPVDLRTATQFVNNHVTDQLAPEKLSKLARLARSEEHTSEL